ARGRAAGAARRLADGGSGALGDREGSGAACGGAGAGVFVSAPRLGGGAGGSGTPARTGAAGRVGDPVRTRRAAERHVHLQARARTGGRLRIAAQDDTPAAPYPSGRRAARSVPAEG